MNANLAAHAKSRGGIAIRLSLDQIIELEDRAPIESYMIVQAADGTWVEIHPYVDESES